MLIEYGPQSLCLLIVHQSFSGVVITDRQQDRLEHDQIPELQLMDDSSPDWSIIGQVQ